MKLTYVLNLRGLGSAVTVARAGRGRRTRSDTGTPWRPNSGRGLSAVHRGVRGQRWTPRVDSPASVEPHEFSPLRAGSLGALPPSMPSPAHETLVTLLRNSPVLLPLLLDTMGLPPLPAPMTPDDATLRVANPVEVRPDLLLVEKALTGHWALVEVQLGIDPDKQRRWLAATALLYDARGTMGDLLVITHEASVAAWAHSVAQTTGPGGTHLSLHPRVLLLTREAVDRLLAADRPEMAVMAAWAVHDQTGRPAQKVVRAAFEQISNAPDPELRATLVRAMLSMLDNTLLHVVREMMMLNRSQFPITPALREFFREMEPFFAALAKVEAKAEAVIAVLDARGLLLDDASRARILACTDTATLDRWITRAATAPTLAAVFAEDA